MPDIKSALQNALAKAPAPLQPKTQMEQVWLWIKDHPNITLSRLNSAMKHIPEGNIGSLTAQMVKRGMLETTEQRSPTAHIRGKKTVNGYRVPANMPSYELLPLPPKVEKPQRPVQPTTPQPITPAETKAPEPAAAKQQEPSLLDNEDVSRWPLTKAIAVYRQLRTILGDIQ